MACPTCSHTMQGLGSEGGTRAIFWCPRCGTLKVETENAPDDVSIPKLVDYILEGAVSASGPIHVEGRVTEYVAVAVWYWRAACEAAGVACVNACVGIPTEELEEGPNLYALRGMVNAGNEVRAQRDELLAVCEALGDDIQRYLERGGTLTETELRHYERLITVVLRCGLAQAPPAEESP